MPEEYTKSTDTEHEIKLESTLLSATWRPGQAIGGQEMPFEVRTSFVGAGAKVKVKGKSENGKSLGSADGTMRNNVYMGALTIPEDIELGDMVYFEVKLPDNGLSGESNRIPARPPVEVTNMKWSADEARRGDTLKLTADIDEVPNETEAVITIKEYDQDGVHDLIAEIPTTINEGKVEVLWDYEYHEDTDEIPTQEELEKYGNSYNPPEYFFTIKIGAAEYGKEQESGILEFKDWFEVQYKEPDGTPAVEWDYTAILPDGSEKKGKTDDNGYVKLKGIPPGKIEVRLGAEDEEEEDSDDDSESESEDETDSSSEEEVEITETQEEEDENEQEDTTQSTTSSQQEETIPSDEEEQREAEQIEAEDAEDGAAMEGMAGQEESQRLNEEDSESQSDSDDDTDSQSESDIQQGDDSQSTESSGGGTESQSESDIQQGDDSQSTGSYSSGSTTSQSSGEDEEEIQG